ncbi:MAG: 3'-5' exonuclease [Myxococcota bacterium]
MTMAFERGIVVDIEATCWHPDEHAALSADQRNECEIIEIGAVRFPLDGEPAFRRVIKPRRHPRLSAFCTRLTGLTQADVDGGMPFAEAYTDFLRWIEPHTVVGSWGTFDHRQFARDCRRASMEPPPWQAVNLRSWLAKRLRKRGETRTWMRLDEALARAGLGFEGTPHRAVADAHNTARLIPWGNDLLEL